MDGDKVSQHPQQEENQRFEESTNDVETIGGSLSNDQEILNTDKIGDFINEDENKEENKEETTELTADAVMQVDQKVERVPVKILPSKQQVNECQFEKRFQLPVRKHIECAYHAKPIRMKKFVRRKITKRRVHRVSRRPFLRTIREETMIELNIEEGVYDDDRKQDELDLCKIFENELPILRFIWTLIKCYIFCYIIFHSFSLPDDILTNMIIGLLPLPRK